MIPIAVTRRPWLRAALAALAIGLAACGDSLLSDATDSVRVVPSVPAPYKLMTVNGQAPPVEMRRDSTVRVMLTEGELMLGGTSFSQRLTLVDTAPNGVGTSRASTTQGFISVSGDKVHFRASDGAEWDGTARPGWIVYTVPGNSGPVTFSFRQN
jgi:hypothetical protein